MSNRYIVTRMQKDRTAPLRYQRAGWMAFDTQHQQHGQVWPVKAAARADADRLNRVVMAAEIARHNIHTSRHASED